MKFNLLTIGGLVVALAMPLGVCAQQSQQPPAQAQGRTTPSGPKIQHRWMKRFGDLNLSGSQQQQIQSIIDQYAQAHPEGSPVDRDAAHSMRQQIMGVLTTDQQNQFRAERRARRQQMQQRQAQGQQQPTQGQPGQQYQQQQYQQPPSEQQPPNEQQPSDQQPAGPPPA